MEFGWDGWARGERRMEVKGGGRSIYCFGWGWTVEVKGEKYSVELPRILCSWILCICSRVEFDGVQSNPRLVCLLARDILPSKWGWILSRYGRST